MDIFWHNSAFDIATQTIVIACIFHGVRRVMFKKLFSRMATPLSTQKYYKPSCIGLLYMMTQLSKTRP
jgi:hypothetical protein